MLEMRRNRGGTIGESVYKILRKNIIDIILVPGQDINMKDITEELNVSRSPVRDAVIKLNEEGLVDSIPQRGTAVSRIDLDRVENERFMRHSLEEKVLLFCLEKDMGPYIDQLNYLMEKQKEFLVARRYRELLDYDDAFHETLFAAAGKEYCWKAIQSLVGHYRRIRLMSLWDMEITENVYQQHQELVACLLKKDKQRLLDVLSEHLSKLWREEEGLLNSYPDYFKPKAQPQDGADRVLQYTRRALTDTEPFGLTRFAR